MQNRFLKFLYLFFAILFLCFLAFQPFNIFCKTTKKCYPITLQSFDFSKKGNIDLSVSLFASVSKGIQDVVEFYPKQEFFTIKSNQYISSSYIVKNLTNQELSIKAQYISYPEDINKYLERVECLCFQMQYLEPNQQVEMPIKFKVKDNIKEINLNEISIGYAIIIE
jgi:cytochrome c oxidase assembly protein subunit 11